MGKKYKNITHINLDFYIKDKEKDRITNFLETLMEKEKKNILDWDISISPKLTILTGGSKDG